MGSKIKFQSPTGMHDILPELFPYYKKVEKVSEKIADFYDFRRVETPILENAEIFKKGTGFSSDIVLKQMYSLRTKGGDFLTLRPEGTPSIVRAYLENGFESLPKPINLWHFGPFFRYERPQAGRFRQFYQVGFESLGSSDPIVDIIIIQIFLNLLKEIGFKNLIIEINSIGDFQCRPHYKRALTSYFRSYLKDLCPDCRERFDRNPLRILDCKNEKCQEIIASAPQTLDFLCKECHDHFKKVLEFLDYLEIPYELNPHLVRGLDYYTKTVFEIFIKKQEKKSKERIEEDEQDEQVGALVGGGRYDSLVRVLGGKDTPACGGALGVERVIEILKKTSKIGKTETKAGEIFLAQIGESAKRESLKILEEFRKAKIKHVGQALSKDSLTAQFKIADKLNVKYVLILGQKELLNKEIILREMKTGKQKTIPLKKVVKEVIKVLKKEK